MNQNDINLVYDYSNFMEEYVDSDLEHYGVPKMRWHHRRWQYEDGSLTPAGRDHYGVGPPRAIDPDHPITSRMAKAAQGFKERRAIAKIYAEKEARDKRLQEGKKAAKLKREQRAREVKEMTRTPDDLVKNRDKLTDEEFKAAVEKFEKLKQIDTENSALLKKYNGLKDDSPKEELDDDEYEDYDGTSGRYPWGRKYQNPDGTLTEEGKAKFASEREKQVAKWTKTAEDLVKNRDKLTEEEFKQAVIRFDQERNKKLENEAILKAFGGASDYEQRRQARSAEKVAEAYRKYNAKELIKHKGEFTKEEFDQLKVLVAAKSTSDLKKLTTYLSADEYQTALDRYAKTEGARKGQVVQDLRNAGSNVKSIVDMIDQGYKVADNASKMTTGRSIQDLAKNATGTAFMSLLEKADLDNALSRAKASKAAADSAEAVTQGVADVLKRAKNMSDKEYAEAMEPYYDDVMDILTGNNGGKNDKKNNKGDKNQNPQQQGNKKKDKQGGDPFPDYQEQRGSSDAQSTSESPKKKKKEKQQQATQEPNVGHNLGNATIGGKKPENMGYVYDDAGHYHEDLKFGTKAQNAKRSIFDTLGGQDTSNMKSNQDASHKVEREIFGKNNTSNMEVKPDALHKVKDKIGGNKASNMETELERAFRTTDTGKSSITFGSKNKKAEKVPTLSFDDPFAGHDFSKASLTFDSAPTKHAPTLSFGGDDDGPAPKVKPMSSKEYDDIMSKLTNDIADFQRKTSTDYKPNVTVDDVYDEVMRKLRG